MRIALCPSRADSDAEGRTWETASELITNNHPPHPHSPPTTALSAPGMNNCWLVLWDHQTAQAQGGDVARTTGQCFAFSELILGTRV